MQHFNGRVYINYAVETAHTHIAEKDINITKDQCSHLKVISLHQEQGARNKAKPGNYYIL